MLSTLFQSSYVLLSISQCITPFRCPLLHKLLHFGLSSLFPIFTIILVAERQTLYWLEGDRPIVASFLFYIKVLTAAGLALCLQTNEIIEDIKDFSGIVIPTIPTHELTVYSIIYSFITSFVWTQVSLSSHLISSHLSCDLFSSRQSQFKWPVSLWKVESMLQVLLGVMFWALIDWALITIFFLFLGFEKKGKDHIYLLSLSSLNSDISTSRDFSTMQGWVFVIVLNVGLIN